MLFTREPFTTAETAYRQERVRSHVAGARLMRRSPVAAPRGAAAPRMPLLHLRAALHR